MVAVGLLGVNVVVVLVLRSPLLPVALLSSPVPPPLAFRPISISKEFATRVTKTFVRVTAVPPLAAPRNAVAIAQRNPARNRCSTRHPPSEVTSFEPNVGIGMRIDDRSSTVGNKDTRRAFSVNRANADASATRFFCVVGESPSPHSAATLFVPAVIIQSNDTALSPCRFACFVTTFRITLATGCATATCRKTSAPELVTTICPCEFTTHLSLPHAPNVGSTTLNSASATAATLVRFKGVARGDEVGGDVDHRIEGKDATPRRRAE